MLFYSTTRKYHRIIKLKLSSFVLKSKHKILEHIEGSLWKNFKEALGLLQQWVMSDALEWVGSQINRSHSGYVKNSPRPVLPSFCKCMFLCNFLQSSSWWYLSEWWKTVRCFRKHFFFFKPSLSRNGIEVKRRRRRRRRQLFLIVTYFCAINGFVYLSWNSCL